MVDLTTTVGYFVTVCLVMNVAGDPGAVERRQALEVTSPPTASRISPDNTGFLHEVGDADTVQPADIIGT